MSTPGSAFAATLTIDLDAVAANYRLLQAKTGRTRCGAAVKADAYGLGVAPVARTLWAEGCRDFFVAHIQEGMAVRDALPDATVHILNGLQPNNLRDFLAADLTPVLNSAGDIERWRKFAWSLGRPLPADVHIDTGMCRLGLDLAETEALLAEPAKMLDGVDVNLVMSHLASADDIESDQSARQLVLFKKIAAKVKGKRYSFANSSGIFLGPEYHFDVARPGIALYGGNPVPHTVNPMQNPVTLTACILQVRHVAPPETVGYGARHAVTGPTRIATVPVGYADGYHRSGSGKGVVHIGGFEAPIVGRVSMDLITLDVTGVPESIAVAGASVEFMGRHRTPDDLARDWQTIPYEVLTGLGRRYGRVYTGGAEKGLA